jgi:Fic family protein
MSFNPEQPFNKLPLLPPSKDLETRAVLKKTVIAARELAALNGIKDIIPNSTILINTIVLQEAKISSEIENVVTTNDALYKALGSKGNNLDPQTKEVLAYRDAVWDGYNRLKQRGLLTTNLFIDICNRIKNTDAGIRKIPGTVLATSSGRIIYTPPVGEKLIRDKLGNLEKYINTDDDDIDPLIKLAVQHYQFEAIHPFPDGNGRTGRLLCILYLIKTGLLDLPILYLSKYIIENRSEYQRLLLEVTKSDEWEAWILFILEGIEQTAKYTHAKVTAIRQLLDKTLEKAKAELPSRAYSKELIELLFVMPYCRIQSVVDAKIAERQAAASYLDNCAQIGILKKQRFGRENIYTNVLLFKLLSQ